jgi:hypothetical protein
LRIGRGQTRKAEKGRVFMNTNPPADQKSGVRTARGLWFTAARRAELIEEPVNTPSGTEVTVRAIASLVSAGTEMLVYRGELPAEDDLGLETCAGSFGFPVKYAYQVVGEVMPAGRAVFVNLLEVAVNCHLDVPVRFGDVVVVYGQGVVGSLVAQLARRMAGTVVVVDPIAGRRAAALNGVPTPPVRGMTPRSRLPD